MRDLTEMESDERQILTKSGSERKTERECVFMCVCVGQKQRSEISDGDRG